MVRLGRNRVLLRYWSDKTESRLMCLSRQAQSSHLPTLWGLPRAHLTERACICNGDDHCAYELRVHETRRWLPILGGALAGGMAAAALYLAGMLAVPEGALSIALPSIGALLGYLYELRRTNRENFRISESINGELRLLVERNTSDQREILDLHRRQRRWSRILEEQVAERTRALEEVVARIQALQEERQITLRGVSHDLSNPLNSLMLAVDFIEETAQENSGELKEVIDEQRQAARQMRSLLEELMALATSDNGLVKLTPQLIDVKVLEDQLRRRLKALVHGRQIRVSVFATREAPEHIEMDRLLLDRVLDNLLTNAAKYTERGSIVVELDGRPDRLTVKVSDTGRGIDKQNIQRIFQPGGSAPDGRRWGGYGVGLSVVVQLLNQVGGELEVMSLPSSGTTFWAHFPVEIRRSRASTRPEPSQTTAEMIDNVVTIRPPPFP
jgi:signal transduction histidine kinase